MKKNNEKSEKELFDEEIKNWPLELEQLAEELNKKYNLLYENKPCDFKSIEDIRKYYNSTPWEEFVKEWIK